MTTFEIRIRRREGGDLSLKIEGLIGKEIDHKDMNCCRCSSDSS